MEAASEVAHCDGDTSGIPRGGKKWRGEATKKLNKNTWEIKDPGKFQ